MAMIYILGSGFDFSGDYATLDAVSRFPGTGTSSNGTAGWGNGRFGGNAFSPGGNSNAANYPMHTVSQGTLDTGTFASNYESLCGFNAVKFASGASSDYVMQFGDNGVGCQLTLRFWAATGTGNWALYRGTTSGTLLASGASDMIRIDGLWFPVQWGTKINGTTGDFWLRVNNEVLCDLTNINTQNTANPWINRVFWGKQPDSTATWIDDCVVFDPNGETYDTLPVDARFYTSSGIDDVSNTTDWTVNTSTPAGCLWQSDEDGSYITTGTPGAIESLKVNPDWIPSFATPVGPPQLMCRARIDDATPRTIRYGVMHSNVYAYSNSFNPFSSYTYCLGPVSFPLNPNTNAVWTLSELNSMYLVVIMDS